eukprot:622294-Amorphochlora_amoeboformis.AAC.1
MLRWSIIWLRPVSCNSWIKLLRIVERSRNHPEVFIIVEIGDPDPLEIAGNPRSLEIRDRWKSEILWGSLEIQILVNDR